MTPEDMSGLGLGGGKPRPAAPAGLSSLNARNFFRQLTSQLEAAGIRHVFVGDTRTFPEQIPSDLDIVVSKSDFGRLPAFIRQLSIGSSARLIQALHYQPLAWYFVLTLEAGSDGLEFVAVDICGSVSREGRLFLHTDELIAGRSEALDAAGRSRGFFIAPPEWEFLYYLLKRIDKQELGARHGEHLTAQWRLNIAACRQLLEGRFTKDEQAMIAEAAESGDWTAVAAGISRLRKSLRRHLPISPGNYWLEIMRLLRRMRKPTGLMVAVLGPDGSGKSSVLRQLETGLAPAFRHVASFHFRPRLTTTSAAARPTTTPHDQRPRGVITATLKLAYLWADYVAGYWWAVWPRLARSTLVLFDRYYQDLLVDPRRYRFAQPTALARLIGRLVPGPDLWIILEAPAELLLQRKAEMTLQEARRLQEAYRALATTLNHAVIVDATQPLPAVSGTVMGIVLDHLERRLALQIPPEN